MQQALETAMVKAGIATTTAAVGQFMQEHLAHRAAARKKAIDKAIEALAQGASSSGRVVSVPDITTHPSSPRLPLQTPSDPLRPAMPSESTTGGASAMMVAHAPPPSRTTWPFVVAGAAVVLAVAGVGVGFKVKSSRATATTQTTQSEPHVVPVTTVILDPGTAETATPPPTAATSAAPPATASASASATSKPIWAAPKPTDTVKKKPKIDDGF
jgi:hypothetical protein